jgi:pimeloyl-ACP methyl ester carboxylesterase
MAVAEIDGVEIAYEVLGDGERTWVITPGGRFSKDDDGVRRMAAALVERGQRVILWDRPNCGESGIAFTGASETDNNADALAGLLRELDLGPVVVSGGSAGSRVALATVARHPDVATGVATWLISGGVYGSISLAGYYCGDSFYAAWTGGMEAVAELPTWREVLERNPPNRERLLALDPQAFVATMERWLAAYPPTAGQQVPGLPDAKLAAVAVPTLVLRSSPTDPFHPQATSDAVAGIIPGAELVEPAWSQREWLNRVEGGQRGESWCSGWPLLAPQLVEWSDRHAL